jgi:hypothetical protein
MKTGDAMGQTLVGSYGLLIAIAFASTAHGGDRKSTPQEIHESKGSSVGSQQSHAILISAPVRSGRSNVSLASPFEGRYSDFGRRLAVDEKENSNGPKEHKSLILFHLDSKLGEIKVQPVIGKVTGAQFCLGF